MKKTFVASGRLSSKARAFSKVVADVRQAVFAVVRNRPIGDGKYQSTALGSGFFVSSNAFLTCAHVLNHATSPHRDGDFYTLSNNLDGEHGMIHEVRKGIDKDIFLYPEHDAAILISGSKPDQAFVPISYSDVPVGQEIGVAGYPLARILADENGNATLSGMPYRVAKGVVTAYYKTVLNNGFGQVLKDVHIVEVNFLFVPGNSGGPIFDAETGRVIAFVEGFMPFKIAERKETCQLIQPPAGMSPDYLDSVYAVYSNGLTLEPIRGQLEKFGVSL